MPSYEPLGYLASALVLTAFWMRAMLPLRAIAIASNVAFISYGLQTGIMPVLLLHLLLLPMNLIRLAQTLRKHLRQRELADDKAGPSAGSGREPIRGTLHARCAPVQRRDARGRLRRGEPRALRRLDAAGGQGIGRPPLRRAA